MDQSLQSSDHVKGEVGHISELDRMGYALSAYQTAPNAILPVHQDMSLANPVQHPLNWEPMQQQYQMQLQQRSQRQQEQLQAFWAQQMEEVEQVTNFKSHSLPLARIKKIMRADEDVRMISAEAPVVFARACEMFILELTLRGWMNAEEEKRRTLQRDDIAAAVHKTEIFDFLVDIIPKDETKEELLPRMPFPASASIAVDQFPGYYYPAAAMYGGQQQVPYMSVLEQAESVNSVTPDGGSQDE